jgi:hypothetical protein
MALFPMGIAVFKISAFRIPEFEVLIFQDYDLGDYSTLGISD